MHQEYPPDAEVDGWLKTLGVESLCQWDVLIFLYHHQTCLFGVDFLASLMGYATNQVVAALEVLESRELVRRSRVSQGVRLYEFAVPFVPPPGGAWERLLDLANHRAGRLRVSGQLRLGNQTGSEETLSAQRPLEGTKQDIRATHRGVRRPEERRQTWRKAI